MPGVAYMGLRGLRVYLHCPFLFAIQLIFYYCHNELEAVVDI